MKRILLIALLALGAFPVVSNAADTANINVTVTVTGTCKFVDTPDAAFGALDPAAGGNVTTTTGIKFWCTKGAAYTLAADNGTNYDSAGSVRRMKGPGALDYIPYTLTPSSTSGSGTGKSTPITVTLTGSVLGTDYINASQGTYQDVVQLTITP